MKPYKAICAATEAILSAVGIESDDVTLPWHAYWCYVTMTAELIQHNFQ